MHRFGKAAARAPDTALAIMTAVLPCAMGMQRIVVFPAYRPSAVLLLALLAAFPPGFASAQDVARSERSWPSHRLPPARAELPPCTCRAAGADHAVGSSICLEGRRLRCVMEQNVTSWRSEPGECHSPVSLAPAPRMVGRC
jgi:hypothetical protein